MKKYGRKIDNLQETSLTLKIISFSRLKRDQKRLLCVVFNLSANFILGDLTRLPIESMDELR